MAGDVVHAAEFGIYRTNKTTDVDHAKVTKDNVIARVTRQRVTFFSTKDNVSAGITVDRVNCSLIRIGCPIPVICYETTHVAKDGIITGLTINRISVLFSQNGVIATTTVDDIRSRTAIDEICRVSTADLVITTATVDVVSPCTCRNVVAARTTVQRIIPTLRGDHIVTRPTIDRVVTRSPHQPVIPVTAPQHHGPGCKYQERVVPHTTAQINVRQNSRADVDGIISVPRIAHYNAAYSRMRFRKSHRVDFHGFRLSRAANV